MGSRSVKDERESKRVGRPVYRREATIGDDLKDIAVGIGRSVARPPSQGGGMLGDTIDKVKRRKRMIDEI